MPMLLIWLKQENSIDDRDPQSSVSIIKLSLNQFFASYTKKIK